MPTYNPVAHAVNHEARKLMIEALWHKREPLTAARFYKKYIQDSRVSLSQIAYHVRQLDKDGIIKLDAEPEDLAHRRFVLAGPTAARRSAA